MNIIGLMSGTSLDGLDIALCRIDKTSSFSYRILAAETVPYSTEWRQCLATLEQASAYDYALADVRLGHYFGSCVNSFLQRHPAEVHLIASHGHTVFHQPHLGLTTQIGSGDAIAAQTGLPVACNFRTLDVALGGQGAPLVPIGDKLLFHNYDACLNLGGFSNISFEQHGQRIAFDVAPCNMALNLLARRVGKSYDDCGKEARKGRVVPQKLNAMNALPYYALPAPKSLGKEWFVACFEPLLSSEESTHDLLCTVVEHIAQQVANVVNVNKIESLLITGGGAHNLFLVERIEALCSHSHITVPDAVVVDYKEALVFALLGYLRWHGHTNCLASVTGARHDNCGGSLLLGH